MRRRARPYQIVSTNVETGNARQFIETSTKLKPNLNGQRLGGAVLEELQQDAEVEEAHAQAAHLQAEHASRRGGGCSWDAEKGGWVTSQGSLDTK